MAAAPFGKRRIALEKLAAHITVLTVTVVIFALATALVGVTFGSLPEDAISAQSAIGFALWIGLMALAFGGLAFALAPFLGRGLAGGIAGALLVGGYVLSNYSASVPAFGGIAYLTPWKWTADHLPLAGQFDWASLVPVAIVALVLLVIGVEAFARRDLGATSSFGLPAMPAVLLGEDGPDRAIVRRAAAGRPGLGDRDRALRAPHRQREPVACRFARPSRRTSWTS